MSSEGPAEWIVPTTGAKTLPAVDILTGRGFVTGKSGSGKSNTASVIAEELLDNNYNLLIVDPEGEYYGLKESYEMLHVGNDDLCDVQVTPEDADKIAALALERNVPVILDVSDYLDGDEAKALIKEVATELFQKEKQVRKPFLLMVEEMQEYLPQQGGNDELSEVLERVAKRGRKRGLGLLGMSQRPSSVDKDFITQCDWMVWHRLNWKNDLDVVKNILGPEKAADIEDFGPGEAYLMTDWDDSVEQVTFKRKKTHDAGATPGLESYERPDTKTVSTELVAAIEGDAEIDDVPEQDRLPPSPSSDEPAPASPQPDEQDSSEDPLEFGTQETPTEVDGVGDGSEGVSEPPTEVTFYSEEDLAQLDDDTLSAHVQTLQEQNQLLKDEIEEVRDIQSSPSDSSPFESPADMRPASDAETSTVSPPSKPTPPSTAGSSGVGAVLVEFTAMTNYLFKSLVYRWRLLKYKLAKQRRKTTPSPNRDSDNPQDL